MVLGETWKNRCTHLCVQLRPKHLRTFDTIYTPRRVTFSEHHLLCQGRIVWISGPHPGSQSDSMLWKRWGANAFWGKELGVADGA